MFRKNNYSQEAYFERILNNLYAKHSHEFTYNKSVIHLSEIEEKTLCIYFCTYSQLFRSDYEIDEAFKQYINNVLDKIISKMPYFEGEQVCRYCNRFDKCEFKKGDYFFLNYSLTTSSTLLNMMTDDKWTHKYIINTAIKTKAHNLYMLWPPEYMAFRHEYQVNFERNAKFIITDIKNIEGRPHVYMDEI